MHTHTEASSCSRMSPQELVEAAERKGLDGIAVTDHDTMSNVEPVKEATDELKIIPGVEISTDTGHMLAWFMDEVPKSSDPIRVIEEVHNQGGFVSLAHPRDFLRQNFNDGRIYKKTDYVECINSRVLPFWRNKEAKIWAKRHNKPFSAGSDAHFKFEVGRAYILTDEQPFRALELGDIQPVGRGGYFSGHIFTKLNDLKLFLKS